MKASFPRLALSLALAALGCGCSVDTAPTDLRTLDRSFSPNDALACPPASCTAKADIESPAFALEPAQLGEIVRGVVTGQARTELVGEDPEMGQLVFVQRSKVFGFADTIWVQIVDLESRTSIIIYSRSNFGFWDLGVNARRVRSWLAEIESAAVPAGKRRAGVGIAETGAGPA